MSETQMPAAEAEVVTDAPERVSYELAFHVLPTVAEGEVPTVFAAIKDTITKAGSEIFDEETPERLDLAYEIVEHIEGKNRKFASAYFGWLRFKTEASHIAKITSEIEARSDILRHLLIKLTRAEEEHPFRFHEALKEAKMVTTVEESSVIPDVTTVSSEEAPATEHKETEESGEVDEEALDEALKNKDV